MSLQQKRVVWLAFVSLCLLLAGIAFWIDGNDRTSRTFNQEIRWTGPNTESQLVDFTYRLAGNELIAGLGISLSVAGLVGILLSAAVWIKKPATGSMLTLRGWKAPEEISEGAVAAGKAWEAASYGVFGSMAWIPSFGFGSLLALQSHSRLFFEVAASLLVVCGLFYGLGIRLCRKRDRQQASAAQGPWKFALALNYGGLVAFLCSIGAVLIIHSQS